MRHAPTPYRRRANRSRGLTFLEIIVVVTILGILLALSSPSLRNMYQKMQLSSSARQIGSLCKYARAAAIMQEGEVRLLVDLETARYRLKLPPKVAEDDRQSHSRYRNMEDQKKAAVEEPTYLPPDVEFVEILTDAPEEEQPGKWQTVLVYYQNGSATPCVMTLENRRGRRVTIEVQHATGGVRIYMGDPVFKQPALADETNRGYSRQNR